MLAGIMPGPARAHHRQDTGHTENTGPGRSRITAGSRQWGYFEGDSRRAW